MLLGEIINDALPLFLPPPGLPLKIGGGAINL
jgi:hypothetical protein